MSSPSETESQDSVHSGSQFATRTALSDISSLIRRLGTLPGSYAIISHRAANSTFAQRRSVSRALSFPGATTVTVATRHFSCAMKGAIGRTSCGKRIIWGRSSRGCNTSSMRSSGGCNCRSEVPAQYSRKWSCFVDGMC